MFLFFNLAKSFARPILSLKNLFRGKNEKHTRVVGTFQMKSAHQLLGIFGAVGACKSEGHSFCHDTWRTCVSPVLGGLAQRRNTPMRLQPSDNDMLLPQQQTGSNPGPAQKIVWSVGERNRSRLTDSDLKLEKSFTLPGSFGAITALVGQIFIEVEVRREKERSLRFMFFTTARMVSRSTARRVIDCCHWTRFGDTS